MEKMRAYKKVRQQNKKATLLSFAIIAIGLIFTYFKSFFDIDIGYYLIVAGVSIFFVTSMLGLFAAGSLRK